MIKDVIDSHYTTRLGDSMALIAIAFTAANIQTYVAIVSGTLACLFYLTKLYDWWDKRGRD